jgi:hypothetical protein
MRGFSHGLNSGLLHISARMDVMASQNYPVLSSLKISALETVWMLSLNEAQLNALDLTPVSILRFTLPRQNYEKLSDSNFGKASFNNYLLAEGTNFVHTTHADPYLTLGLRPDDLEWFSDKSFIERIGICDHHTFEVRIRVDTKRLDTENTKEAALHNTCLILSTELNHRSNNDLDAYHGNIKDYGRLPHETQNQTKEMLFAGVRISIVAAATSQVRNVVGNYARRLLRNVTSDEIDRAGTRGRVQNVQSVCKTDRVQAVLFMLIYKTCAANSRFDLNSKAALYAYKQFSFMLAYMGYKEHETLSISDCFILINGNLSGIVMVSKCPHCSMLTLQLPEKPKPCTYCHKKF